MRFFNWLLRRKPPMSDEHQRLYDYQKEINRQCSEALKAEQLKEISERAIQTKLVSSNWRRQNESAQKAQADIEATLWSIKMQEESVSNKIKFALTQLDEVKIILESLLEEK